MSLTLDTRPPCPARAIDSVSLHIHRCDKPNGHKNPEHIAPRYGANRPVRWEGDSFVIMHTIRPQSTPLDLALEDRYQPDSAAFSQGWKAACQTVIAALSGDQGANYERSYSFGDAANMAEGLMESTADEQRTYDKVYHRALVALQSDGVALRRLTEQQ